MNEQKDTESEPKDGEAQQPIKRVAIYARKSSAYGVDGQIYNSIDAQLDMCRSYVQAREERKWVVTAEFSDMGVSGKSLNRPGFQQMLASVRAGEIDIIVAYRIDRISRSMLDYLNLQEELNRLGVGLAMCAQNLDTSTIDGRLSANIWLSFAQYERELDSARIREKLAASAERGIFVGGVAPYGYIRKGKEGLLVDENTAPEVREIFKRFAAGERYCDIAAALNKRGVPAPMKPSKNAPQVARLWDTARISRLVSRPVYFGEIVFRGRTFPAQHTPLVPQDALASVTQRLLDEEENKLGARQKREMRYPLRRILICPECGCYLGGTYAMKQKSGKAVRYYVCPQHKSTKRKDRCSYKGISATAVEEAMLAELSALAKEDSVLDAICNTVPGLKRRDVANALRHTETLAAFIPLEQQEALFRLVFHSATYDREKGELQTERHIL